MILNINLNNKDRSHLLHSQKSNIKKSKYKNKKCPHFFHSLKVVKTIRLKKKTNIYESFLKVNK